MNTAQRTLEQRVKYDYGLTIGTHLVEFSLGENKRLAMIRISPRGLVHCLAKPKANQMHSAWDRLKGDKFVTDKGVIVWGARDPQLMEMFDGAPAARIPLAPLAV